MIAGSWRHRGAALWALAAWDLRERAQSSVLGLGWTLLSPLLRILVFYAVFFHILGVKAPPQYSQSGPGFWLTAGLLPWLWVADGMGRAPGLVLERASSFRNGAFPGELLAPMNLLSSGAYHLGGLAVLWVLMAWEGVAPGLRALACLPWALAAVLLSLGLSWFSSALNVYWRDTAQVNGVILNAWVYATPIVYPRSLAPEAYQPLLQLNPMTHIVEGYRAAWLGAAAPLWDGLAYALALSAGLALVGAWFFRRLQPGFAEEL